MTRRTRSPFAQKLFEYRKLQRRLTQVEYAAELGIHPISLSRYELDKSPVGDEWLAQEFFRVTKVMPPRTSEELSALLADGLRESKGPGAARTVVSEASEEEARPAQARPRRHRRGQGRA